MIIFALSWNIYSVPMLNVQNKKIGHVHTSGTVYNAVSLDSPFSSYSSFVIACLKYLELHSSFGFWRNCMDHSACVNIWAYTDWYLNIIICDVWIPLWYVWYSLAFDQSEQKQFPSLIAFPYQLYHIISAYFVFISDLLSDQKITPSTPTSNHGGSLDSQHGLHSPDSVSEDRPSEEFSLHVLAGGRLSQNADVPESPRNENAEPEKHDQGFTTPTKMRKRRLSGIFPPNETFPVVPAHILPPLSMTHFPASSAMRHHPVMYSPYTCNVYPHPVPFSPPSYSRPPFFVLPLVPSQPASCSISFPEKMSSPVGVLSPAEIPSPSGLVMADEPSQTNGSSGSGRIAYPRQNDVTFLDTPVVQNTPYSPLSAPKVCICNFIPQHSYFYSHLGLYSNEKHNKITVM